MADITTATDELLKKKKPGDPGYNQGKDYSGSIGKDYASQLGSDYQQSDKKTSWDVNIDFADAMSKATSKKELDSLATQRDMKLQGLSSAGLYDAATMKGTGDLLASNYERLGIQSPTVGSSSGGGSSRSSSGSATGTSSSIQEQIASTQKNAAISKIKSMLTATEDQYNKDVATAEQDSLDERIQLGVEDRMARSRTAKLLEQQGLSASGAVPQSDISQNIINANSLASNRKALSDYKAQLLQSLNEARMQANQGIADAETQYTITMLQNQLQQVEKAESDAKNEWLATIGQFSNDYQAEINKVQNDGDPSNDWQIAYLQAARQQKIEGKGLDQNGNPLPVDDTINMTPSQAMQLWGIVGKATPEIAKALGVAEGSAYSTFASRQSSSGGSGGSGSGSMSISNARLLWKDLGATGKGATQEIADALPGVEVGDIYDPKQAKTEAEMWAEEYPYAQVEHEMKYLTDTQEISSAFARWIGNAEFLKDAYGDDKYYKIYDILNEMVKTETGKPLVK